MIYISLLRGINVSGQKKMNMNELKELYKELEYKNVLTVIQSGNVIFKTSDDDINEIIKKIEWRIKDVLGYDVKVLIRTQKDLENIINQNPFSSREQNKIHVTFLSDKPKQIPKNEINKIKNKSEEYFFSGNNLYLYCPNGYGKSKLSNNYFERKLKLSATTRNWNTVNKLLELSQKLV